MDLSLIDRMAFSGNTLNPKERAILSVAITKKQSDQSDLSSVQFWGKISGTTDSYLICVGLQEKFSGVPSKKFFYMTSNGKPVLADLSSPTAKQAAAAVKEAQKPFTGNPTEVPEDAEENEDSEEEAYSEKHRLAFVVSEIDNAVSIVPRGAFLVTPSHRVLKNPTYEGKSIQNTFVLPKLCCYRTICIGCHISKKLLPFPGAYRTC
jgi:radial spoke head protein 9